MCTILIADDNADARKPLARFLKMEGYDVLVAADAPETMATIRLGTPDLMLLDVCMPTMDGLTLLALLQSEGINQIPVILITGLSDPVTRKRAADLSVKEYLVKSRFTLDELLALIRKHLKPAEPHTLC